MKFFNLYPGWRVVAASFVGVSSSPGPYAFAALGVFMLPLSDSFGWSRAEISSAILVLTLTTAAFSPIVGRLVDALGARTVLMASISLLGLCMLLLGTVMSELWHLLVIYGLIGSLAAGSNSLPYMRALSAWFDRNRGLAIGIGIGGIGLGYAYVPLVVQTAIDVADWRWGYFALAGFVFLVAVPVLWSSFWNSPAEAGVSFASERREPETGTDASESGLEVAEVLHSGTFWLISTIFIVLSFVLNGVLTHLVPMLVDRGIEPSIAALAAATVGIMMAVSRVFIGYLVDRIFAPRVAAVCFSLSLLGIALFLIMDQSIWMFTGSLALGLSIGAETDLMAYFAGRYFGLRSYGVVYGLLFASILIGTAFGPVLFGLAFEYWGGYDAILGVSLFLNLVAVLLTLRLGPFPRFGS